MLNLYFSVTVSFPVYSVSWYMMLFGVVFVCIAVNNIGLG
jgi:hypothetical protein